MVELDIKLPKAQFEGTPKNLPAAPTLEKYVDKPRPPFMVPEGTKNLALGKPVKASDMDPIIGEIKLINDGDAETGDGHYRVTLRQVGEAPRPLVRGEGRDRVAARPDRAGRSAKGRRVRR